MTDTPEQTLVLPAAFKVLGVTTGFKPRPADDLRIIIESLPGRGKTQLIANMPGTLILDMDKAAENAVYQKAYRHRVGTYADYVAVKKALLDDAGSKNRTFNRVAFDTVDQFLRMLDTHMCEEINRVRQEKGGRILNTILEFGADGAGYTKLTAALVRELCDLDAAGYPYVLGCHMRRREQKVGDNVHVERRCVMPPSTMEQLVGMVDIKARLRRSMVNVEGYVDKTIDLPGGKTKTKRIKTGKSTVKTQYWFCVMPANAGETDNDTKRRIPELKGVVEISLKNGWQDVVAWYQQAIAEAETH